MTARLPSRDSLFPVPVEAPGAAAGRKRRTETGPGDESLPPNLGKAVAIKVPDLTNRNRPRTCLV